MKQLLTGLALLLFALQMNQAQAEPRANHCVILISVDGLANFYLDDPKADLPTMRRLAKEGARAQGMICSFPTVTWPNHTTLVTGVPPAKHGVIGNNYVDRATGKPVPLIPDPLFDKDEIVKSPTVYDAAHEQGLKTAGIVWPATRNARTLTWTVPDMAGNAWDQYGTPSWMAELRAIGLPLDLHGKWCGEPTGGVQRDWMYTRMARHLLQNHSPNLILIHLVETDHVEHRYGPRTPEAYWAVSYADDRVRDLVDAVENSPLKGKTTIFLCSDHGFFPIRREIRPNVLFKQMGLSQEAPTGAAAGDKTPERAVLALSQGGACAVYILDDDRRAPIARDLRAKLEMIEGVEAVFESKDFYKLGQPTRDQNPHAADFWLSAREGYSFADSFAGDEVVTARATIGGTHGYLPEHDDLLGTCIVWGPDIPAGVSLGKISNLDVAPSIADVLDVDFPSADGKSLLKKMNGPQAAK